MKNIISSTLILSLLTFTALCRSDSLLVAVSSNFHTPMKLISEEFEKRTNYKIILSSGSTKKQFTQIVNGTPFNFFIAADTETIEEVRKIEVNRQKFIFSVHRPTRGVLPSGRYRCKTTTHGFKRSKNCNRKSIFISLWKGFKGIIKELENMELSKNNIVSGINIEQAYQFIKTGNVEIGIIAKSQFMRIKNQSDHSYWIPPQTYILQ